MINQYDDEKFFLEYSKMPRSKGGLTSAGEWSQLGALIPTLKSKRVLDLGCGYGWHCRYAAEQGAVRVLGIDASQKMLAKARSFNCDGIDYRLCGIEQYEYPENKWDCVISNLALHYVADLLSVYSKIRRTLVPGGTFVMNIEHPVFTSGVGQDWIYGADGKKLYWAIDDYFFEGERMTNFLGCPVKKYHHTLSTVVGGLISCGFEITALDEVRPPRQMMDIDGMADELRRPMMLLLRAVCKK
ncbi:MAG TPA: class I SAM-dependent methyltransferase [Candidatus Coproplasma avicola]|uniref:Class I SAM-dependent methyltransferase n=1 Tax=Candidatus Coproplasma avicola TaxID=2840744 RepID=A0A9D1J9D8_9FIRM|nr:class I SAM-dependent methyltransferase [Candidatus Coproplasma avicola]